MSQIVYNPSNKTWLHWQTIVDSITQKSRLVVRVFLDNTHVYHWIKLFLADNGHPEMTVHAKPSTTANIYAHAK